MQTLVERGCGLDVHQATVVACLLIVLKNGQVQKQIRTFGTTTRELLALREWLLSQGCTHVAMESTGVYWKPVYAALEGGALEIVVANAQHVKKVPGRKTDVKDAEWIADLLCHGLLRSSFVPPKPIRELRDLTRYRRKLVESQAAERNRLLKLLETANIKLSRVQLVRESQIRCARLPKAHRRLANSAKCPINRAPIIGGTTGGGAHPVSSHRIHAHFLIGMPFARAINPISKTNWEGTGVEPDVK